MSINPEFCSILAPVVKRYLTLMTALGRQYTIERAVLRSLDTFLFIVNATDLTSDIFQQWARKQEHLRSGVRRSRLRIIRNLCLYRRRTEPSCFVPDSSFFPPQHQYVRPYIFTNEQIIRLIAAANMLLSNRAYPLRAHVFRLAIVLLYTMGLRRGELLRLQIRDYDPQQHILSIRPSKFHKERLLPLNEDGVREVEYYLAARRTYRPDLTTAEAPLLWNGSTVLRSYSGPGFSRVFRTLLKETKICKLNGNLPRVHDMRHSFAVNALLRWYRSGSNVQAKLPLLATYMGHVSIVSTQYYLPLLEPLATSASERFDQFCGTLVSPKPERFTP